MSNHEFLVSIDITIPTDMAPKERVSLLEAEAIRGRELREAGHIVRIWRRPGADANIGIWTASSATELHDILSSLPLYPWMSIEVRPLAVHPLERPEEET